MCQFGCVIKNQQCINSLKYISTRKKRAEEALRGSLGKAVKQVLFG